MPKGVKVFVQGEIRNEQFTGDNGQKRYVSKIVVAAPSRELKSLDRPEQDGADQD